MADRTLHVFQIGDCDWVVASNIDDARVVWCEFQGGKPEDMLDEDGFYVVELPDDSLLGFVCDEHGEVCEVGAGTTIKRPCNEWATKLGHGFFGSTEI